MQYKTELHCHTSESSLCATESIIDTIDQYVENGYTTLVLTNHYNKHSEFHARVIEKVPFVDFFLRAWDIGKEYAKGKINLILGCELRFLGDIDINDYLLFGVDEAFMRNHPELPNMNIRDVHKLCNENGILVIQAHPFRFSQAPQTPKEIDGIEIFNAGESPTEDAHNDLARTYANYYPGFIKTVGTDHHSKDTEPASAIITDFPITNNKELVEVLKSGNYSIFCEEEADWTVPPPHTYA